MKSKKKLIILLILAASIIVIVINLFIVDIRFLLVKWSPDFTEVEPNVFISKDIKDDLLTVTLDIFKEAKLRVKELYGNIEGNPVIVIGNYNNIMRKYGLPQNNLGAARGSVLGTFIVIGYRGINTDVIAHEYVHAELFERIGWYKGMIIPFWFHDGLALQVDYRYQYSEQAWNTLTNNGKEIPDVKEHKSSKEFYSNDNIQTRNNYILSKHEVKTWLEKVGRKGLNKLIDKIVSGQSMQQVFAQFEVE